MHEQAHWRATAPACTVYANVAGARRQECVITPADIIAVARMADHDDRLTAEELEEQASTLQRLIDQAKDLQRQITDQLRHMRRNDRPERRRKPR